MALNPWAGTSFHMFGGPYDEEYMTYWSNGGYGGGYGGYNYPMMMWQNGYNRGLYDRDMYAYLYGKHHRRGHRYHRYPSMHVHQHGNGINYIGQFQGLVPWAQVVGGTRRLEGADVIGLAAMGMPLQYMNFGF